MPCVTISTTPVLISPRSTNRIDVIITNQSAVTCYIADSTVVAGQSIYLNQNDIFINDYSGIKGYRGDIWGVTSSGTATICYWERDQ